MQIIIKDIGELIDYEQNARKHPEEQIEQIVQSITTYGYNLPIEIGEDNVIISGHARVEAAKRLGLTQIPTIVHTHLKGDDRRAYVLAANKIALNSSWDLSLLKDELLSLKESDYDLLKTGFMEDELNDLLLDDMLVEGLTNPDECPEVPKDPITRPGDVWILGDHRLMCGDCTIITDVHRLLSGQFPNTMITDPPYGVKYEADWRPKAKNSKKTQREENSNLKNDDRADWYDAYVLFEGSVAYVWHASAFTDVVMDGLRRAGFEIKQQIIWNKNIHALSRSDYHWKHEPCWYAVKKGADRNWKGGRTQMTVWDVASVVCEKDKTAHPTQKPVELFARSINHHTNPGEYVYDPFAGSGTLMIACEKTKRRALMMELDPIYCDVIVNRYEQFTGTKARREC